MLFGSLFRQKSDKPHFIRLIPNYLENKTPLTFVESASERTLKNKILSFCSCKNGLKPYLKPSTLTAKIPVAFLQIFSPSILERTCTYISPALRSRNPPGFTLLTQKKLPGPHRPFSLSFLEWTIMKIDVHRCLALLPSLQCLK